MATGSIRLKPTKKGVHYQITVEGNPDPETGKRNRKYRNVSGSRKEAEKTMRRMISEMENGTLTKKTSKTVKAWMDEWLSTYKPNIAETTRVGYLTKIKDYILPELGAILLSSLSNQRVQRFVNGLNDKGLAPKTVRDTYMILKAALNKAHKLKMISENPCEDIVLPKRQRPEVNVYDVNQIQNLLTAAKNTDLYLPILILVTTGLRRGELLALRWCDIDFKGKTLSVRNNMVRGVDGVIIKEPKSKSGFRTISIGDELLDVLLNEFIVYQERCVKDQSFHDHGLVVCKPDGFPLMPDTMTQKWERFIERNHLPHIRLHDLRHSNATAMIQAGVSPKVVQQRLGHSNIQITLDTYAHVLPSMDEQAAATIDGLILKNA